MKKILLIFVALLLEANHVNCIIPQVLQQNVNTIKEELKNTFGAKNLDLYVITVTRDTRTGNSTTLISTKEFQALLLLLYKLFHNENNPPFSAEERNLLDNSLETKKSDKRKNGALQKDDELAKSVEKKEMTSMLRKAFNLMKDSSKIVVFNEMFFSQEKTLTKSQKDLILKHLKILSNSLGKTVFYINFLYTEDQNLSGREIRQKFDIMRANADTSNQDYTMEINNNWLDLCEDSIVNTKGIENNNSRYNIACLLNETFVIFKGDLLTKYRKSSYFNEDNQFISNGGIYIFGARCDDICYNGNDSMKRDLAYVLLRYTSTEVCLDLNCGIRRSNNWRNKWWKIDWPTWFYSWKTKWWNPSCLHIIQSNPIGPFRTTNIDQLPVDVPIIHADPELSKQYDGLPFCKTDINGRIQSKIGKRKSLFSIKIGDSMYHVNVSCL